MGFIPLDIATMFCLLALMRMAKDLSAYLLISAGLVFIGFAAYMEILSIP